jgi:actinin alpha
VEAHEQFKGTLGEADKEFNSIMSLANEVQRLSQQYGLQIQENPFTTVSPSVSILPLREINVDSL